MKYPDLFRSMTHQHFCYLNERITRLMYAMIDEFTAFIKNEELFTKNDTILLAVSGGIDSVVMAQLFAEGGYRFAIAHVNFGLRGADSDGDEQWVTALAQRYQVPFHTTRLATTEYAAEQGVSTQMAARQLRYAWFEEVLAAQGYARVATAHHQDDQMETTLLNVCQGTGIAGLRGMLAQRGNVVRPLLFATRAHIEAYAQAHQLAWREDQSNASDAYRRNRIRHHIIPQMQQINPNLRATYQLTRERLLATEQLLMNEVKRVKKRCWQAINGEVLLDKRVLKEHPQLTLVLAEIIRPFGFLYQQARDIARCIKEDAVSGKTFTSRKYVLLIDRQHLIIDTKTKNLYKRLFIQHSDIQVSLPNFTLITAHHAAENYALTKQQTMAALDEDLLAFPLTIRPWQSGDWFFPLGMSHRKKLSDFLVDQKVPRHRKPSVYVITSGEDIVWVVGWRIDHRFRITDQTKKVYEISVMTTNSE